MYYADCMPKIIEQARNRIKESGNARAMLSDLAYLIDFCVVRVNLGRGTGATTFIRENMKESDYVIVPTSSYAYHFELPSGISRHQLKEFSLLKSSHGFMGHRFGSDDILWVDDFSYYSRNRIYLPEFISKIRLRVRPNDGVHLIVLLG